MITAELRPFAPPQPKAPAWLLPGLLPRGELVLLEGAASVGKSLLAAAFAARVSQDDACTLLTASPGSSEVLATHLARQEPQYDRLRELVWYAERDGAKDFAAEEALTKLQNHLDEHQPPLLVLDSLEESLVLLAGEKERKLRAFWSRLVALARHHGTTVLVLARPQGRRGAARVARTAAEAAKAVFTLAWHPTDPALRVLTRTRDLTAPAGVQWHVTLDADGRADWAEAAPADHVAPAACAATWRADVRNRPNLRAAVRAIEDALTGPLPALVLRDVVMRQGHTLNAFRTALSLVDAEYQKFGSLWVYSPGPELSVLQELRRCAGTASTLKEPRSEQSPRAKPRVTEPTPPAEETPPAAEPDDLTLMPQETDAHCQVEAKLSAVREAFVQEFGAPALEELFRSGGPPDRLARFRHLNRQAVAAFTPQEREAFIQLDRAYDEWEAKKRQQPPACCARAHPATS